jgi:PAS domain S-box-containing protein
MTPAAKILVVDDYAAMRQAVVRVLQPVGYTMAEAASGAEGLELARTFAPDLMLLDVCLPDLSGLDVCRRLKADPALAHIFVVQLSSLRTDSAAQAEGLDSGADGYISRPIGNAELLARVQAMLRIQHAESALRASERQYRQLVELAQEGIWAVDAEARTTLVNPCLSALLGYTAEEMIGRSLFAFMDETAAGPAREHFARCGQGRTERQDWELLRQDGQRIFATVALSPLPAEPGRFAGAIVLVHDITERKLAGQEREKLIGELQKALADVKTLGGLLPICAACKKVRDDQGYWSQIETFVQTHSEITFTHSLCPECMPKYFPNESTKKSGR